MPLTFPQDKWDKLLSFLTVDFFPVLAPPLGIRVDSWDEFLAGLAEARETPGAGGPQAATGATIATDQGHVHGQDRVHGKDHIRENTTGMGEAGTTGT
jgi:hypothetical protein